MGTLYGVRRLREYLEEYHVQGAGGVSQNQHKGNHLRLSELWEGGMCVDLSHGAGLVQQSRKATGGPTSQTPSHSPHDPLRQALLSSSSL